MRIAFLGVYLLERLGMTYIFAAGWFPGCWQSSSYIYFFTCSLTVQLFHCVSIISNTFGYVVFPCFCFFLVVYYQFVVFGNTFCWCFAFVNMCHLFDLLMYMKTIEFSFKCFYSMSLYYCSFIHFSLAYLIFLLMILYIIITFSLQ